MPIKLIDVTVSIDSNLPDYPGSTPFSLEGIKRTARGDRSNVSSLHMSAHCGSDGAPARAVLRSA